VNDVEQLRTGVRQILADPSYVDDPDGATEAILRLLGPFLDEYVEAFVQVTDALRAVGTLAGSE
jgi:hypothetical protein